MAAREASASALDSPARRALNARPPGRRSPGRGTRVGRTSPARRRSCAVAVVEIVGHAAGLSRAIQGVDFDGSDRSASRNARTIAGSVIPGRGTSSRPSNNAASHWARLDRQRSRCASSSTARTWATARRVARAAGPSPGTARNAWAAASSGVIGAHAVGKGDQGSAVVGGGRAPAPAPSDAPPAPAAPTGRPCASRRRLGAPRARVVPPTWDARWSAHGRPGRSRGALPQSRTRAGPRGGPRPTRSGAGRRRRSRVAPGRSTAPAAAWNAPRAMVESPAGARMANGPHRPATRPHGRRRHPRRHLDDQGRKARAAPADTTPAGKLSQPGTAS